MWFFKKQYAGNETVLFFEKFSGSLYTKGIKNEGATVAEW